MVFRQINSSEYQIYLFFEEYFIIFTPLTLNFKIQKHEKINFKPSFFKPVFTNGIF